MVLITGESGTGKELAARAIHARSRRCSRPFVAVNCAALPETLVESELFGHEKGAFTDASNRRLGCIEMAEGGTLLLDEITEMPLSVQPKLLRILEDLRYRRIGGTTELCANLRILAATNRDPTDAIAQGVLRRDLFYRLSVFQLRLPALRERLVDIPLLAQHYITILNGRHGLSIRGISDTALEHLMTLPWRGNVREFRNVLERAMIVAVEGELQPRHFTFPVSATTPSPPRDGRIDIQVGATIREAERKLIEATLAETGGNKTRAATVLGITARTLHTKLKTYRESST